LYRINATYHFSSNRFLQNLEKGAGNLSNKAEFSIHKDTVVQLQQQLIYYKSELTKYKYKIDFYESELKKKENSLALLKSKQTSVESITLQSENESYDIPEIKKRLEDLSSELERQKERNEWLFELIKENKGQEQLIEHESKLEKKQNQEQKTEAQSIFSYSLILQADEDEDHRVLVIGNYIISNTGNTPLTSPVICLKVKPADVGSLSGKIGTAKRDETMESFLFETQSGTEWEFAIDDWKEKVQADGEYWLRPKSTSSLLPGKQLIFSNFSITLKKPAESNAAVIEGYFYSQEQQTGLPSSNKIVVNL
jgi:hypothetical protein